MEPRKRLALLTLTQSENYGTVLQAHATLALLRESMPHVDFVLLPTDVGHVRRRRAVAVWDPRNGWHAATRAQNLRLMRDFIRPSLGNPSPLDISDYRSFRSWLSEQAFDGYIVGSDEVWNLANVGVPSAYYIPPEVDGYRASFATSANRIVVESLDRDDRSWLAAALRRFDRITVRDSMTADFVRKVRGDDVEVTEVIDPTLLWEFPAEVQPSASPARKGAKRRVLLMLRNRSIAEYVVRACHRNVDFEAVFIPQRGATFLRVSPMEFAGLFSGYSCVVTDFFHGTCMSIRAGVPFISVDTEEVYAKYESKIGNVLRRLSLGDRYRNYSNGFSAADLDEIVSFVRASCAGDGPFLDPSRLLEEQRAIARSALNAIARDLVAL